MNLRLSASEVRVRMDRSEADALARGVSLEQEIAFPGGEVFRYDVHPAEESAPPHASLSRNRLSVSVSARAVRDLLAQPPSRELGISAQLTTAGGAPLRLIIEVDLFTDRKGPRRR